MLTFLFPQFQHCEKSPRRNKFVQWVPSQCNIECHWECVDSCYPPWQGFESFWQIFSISNQFLHRVDQFSQIKCPVHRCYRVWADRQGYGSQLSQPQYFRLEGLGFGHFSVPMMWQLRKFVSLPRCLLNMFDSCHRPICTLLETELASMGRWMLWTDPRGTLRLIGSRRSPGRKGWKRT